MFITLLLRVIVLLLPPRPPRLGPTIRSRMTEFPKRSPIIQTSRNPKTSATVAVCPRPYPGLVVSETPFLLSQFFLTPDSRPSYRYVLVRVGLPSSFPLNHSLRRYHPAASAETPPILRQCCANYSGVPPDCKTIYVSAFIAWPYGHVSTFPLHRYEDRGVCSGSME